MNLKAIDFKTMTFSDWSMFIFGVLAFLLGMLGLFNPDFMLWQLGFEIVPASARASHDYTTVFITASSMASFNMGIYYILAVANRVRKFYLWTVPFRLVTFTFFTLIVLTGAAPARFISVAIWEGLGAVLTGFGLWREGKAAA